MSAILFKRSEVQLLSTRHFYLFYLYVTNIPAVRNGVVCVKQLHHKVANSHNWRPTIRKKKRCCKARKRTCRSREQSGINIIMISKFMKIPTVPKRLKSTSRNFMTSPSSRLRSKAAHLTWCMIHEHRSDCFFSKFYCGSLNHKVSLGTTVIEFLQLFIWSDLFLWSQSFNLLSNFVILRL